MNNSFTSKTIHARRTFYPGYIFARQLFGGGGENIEAKLESRMQPAAFHSDLILVCQQFSIEF